MTDIKIGQHVMVVDANQQYTTYDRWASLNKLRNYERGFRCESGFNGVVTAIANHSTYQNRVLIAVCGDGHEIIINIEGVEKLENKSGGMKPIKRGMKEAVTRDGRKVTQLTWFDGVEDGLDSVCGVLDSRMCTWDEDGKWATFESASDIFAPVEYSYIWYSPVLDTVSSRMTQNKWDSDYETDRDDVNSWYRIEESKREVKE